MKTLICILFLLTCNAWGQDSIQKSKDSNGGLLLTPWKGWKMNGIQKAYYLDGKIRGERSFVDGKIEGTTRMYSPSGKLTAVNYYHNNFHHGTDTSFFENGNISGISSFVNRHYIS